MQLILFRREQRRVGAGVMLCAMLVLGAPSQGAAQQPVPGPSQPPLPIATYRPPALALVQPAAGGSVPQDRPVVVFRFAPGESSDPIDARTFAVTVDGEDRTALFQVTLGEAWGPLEPNASTGAPLLAAGSHQVASRICSIRGACSEVSATVIVVPSSAGSDANLASDRKRSLVDLILRAARKLLDP